MNKRQLKPFFISFSVCFIILACCSFLIFMNSPNFDFDNILARKNIGKLANEPEEITHQYSVSQLTGKTQILFAVKDDTNNISLSFLILADFGNKVIKVNVIDDNVALTKVYSADGENSLKNYVSTKLNTSVDKYVIFDNENFKNFLSCFDGLTINVKNRVDYKSQEFSLLLDSGNQTVSGDIAYKLLLISDDVENILCDIINSVLSPKYVDKSDSLFKSFVNYSTTDISIVDYADKIEILKIYAYSEDRFKPTPHVQGEKL